MGAVPVTCYDHVRLIVQPGKVWRNEEIKLTILRQFGITFQNNTIAKELANLIKQGVIASQRISVGKKTCDEYWNIESNKAPEKETKKSKIERPVCEELDHEQLKSACLFMSGLLTRNDPEYADLLAKYDGHKAMYPEGHPEREKILCQYDGLLRRERLAA